METPQVLQIHLLRRRSAGLAAGAEAAQSTAAQQFDNTADCLKKEGKASWKADAERAKILLEKMRTLQLHPKEIDDFYRICLSLLQAP
jgi:hypothetical protein